VVWQASEVHASWFGLKGFDGVIASAEQQRRCIMFRNAIVACALSLATILATAATPQKAAAQYHFGGGRGYYSSSYPVYYGGYYPTYVSPYYGGYYYPSTYTYYTPTYTYYPPTYYPTTYTYPVTYSYPATYSYPTYSYPTYYGGYYYWR
jgi:hypothetical protein